MAVPSYATDLNDIYTDGGTWTVLTGRATDPDTDDYIQGSSCWSHDPFSSGIEGGVVNSTETVATDDAVFVWTKADISPALATKAAGGVQILIGASSTALDCFYVAGSDTLTYGGWKCIPVDPTLTPSTTIGGGGTGTSYFGVRWNVPGTGPNKGYPFKIDAIRHGRQIEVTAGDSGTPATWSALATYDATTIRQWGICQPNDAGAEVQGIVYWGTATTACYFDDDSGGTIVLIDTEWTSTDFTKIIIDHASTTFNMDGLTIKALGTNNPGQLVFNNASTTAALDNNVFDSIGITTLRAGVTATGNKWKTTGAVTQNGATITDCTFDRSTATEALIVDDLAEVTGCTFNSDGTGHAVDLGTIGSTQSLNWENYESGYAAQGGTAGNRTILVSVSSGFTLTINVIGDASTPTYYNTGAGDVVVVSGTVDLTVTTLAIDGTPVGGVRVILEAADATGDFPFEETVTIVNSGTTATVTHTAHGMATGDYVVIRGASLTANNGAYIITVTTVNAYTYTMTSTPGSSPTGTIKSTFVALYGLSHATTGIITATRSYATAQPVTGHCRKTSAAPYYKTAPLVGDVSTTAGFTATGVMILDQ